MSFPFLDFESSFFTTEELLFLAGASGGGGVEHTIINNPATFTTDMAKPLRKLLIPFTPVQSGSGDPSPTNIRPITGWTGVNIYRSGEDTSDPLTIPVSWQTETGEVYGGTLDALTGVLTVEYGIYDIGSLAWEVANGSGGVKFFRSSVLTGIKKLSSTGIVANIYCSILKTVSAASIYSGVAVDNSIGQDDSSTAKLRVKATSYNDDADAFKTAMNGVMLAYELATPQTVQLDPVTLSTLVGDNVIWTDTNGDNTIVYLKKT